MIKDKYAYSKKTSMYYFFGMLILLCMTSVVCYFAGKYDERARVEKFNTFYETLIDSVYYTASDGKEYIIYIKE